MNGNGIKKRSALESKVARHIQSLTPEQKRCYPFKYAGESWPGYVHCMCPDKKTKIQIDVPRVFPGAWFWGGPNWPDKVLDTAEKRMNACKRDMRWNQMSFIDKLKEAADPNTEVGRQVAIYKPVLQGVQKVLGPAAIVFPPLALIEAAAMAGEKGTDAVFEYIKDL